MRPTPTATPTGRPFLSTPLGHQVQLLTKDPQLPLGLLVVVALFLLAQNQIDKRDPKFATTRTAEPRELDFDGPHRLDG